MSKPDVIGYPTASALRDCLRTEAADSVFGRVVNALVRFGGPGSGTMDGCDCKGTDPDGNPGMGTAWVKVSQVQRTDLSGRGQVRAGAIRQSRCAAPWTITYELAIVRCYPTTSDGSPLPALDVDVTAQKFLADQWAILRAINCCAKLDEHSGTEFVSLNAIGPSGGCAGSIATIRVVQSRG